VRAAHRSDLPRHGGGAVACAALLRLGGCPSMPLMTLNGTISAVQVIP
jgi:hypothetical protein